MIPCPTCKGHNVRGRRGPKLVGRAIFRRHRCQDCGRQFMTLQTVIDSDVMADLADELRTPAA